MEQIACKECTSPDCHGCNMYRLERMLMSGKLDALMDEKRTIKMDADVRPVVKSKWADNHISFYRGCPECGAFVRANLDEVFLRDFPSAVGKLNFCPNCGADMREES